MPHLTQPRVDDALAGVAIGLPFLKPRGDEPVREPLTRTRRDEIIAETRDAAVRRREEDALPLQRENQSMAIESYRSGKIDLATLLQVRHESPETRKEPLEALLKASEAGVGLASAVGIFSNQP